MTGNLSELIGGIWYCDGWDPNLKIFHRIKRTLFKDASRYQNIEVVETHDFGRMLVIDGLPQAAETDEMVYAKAISWPAVLGVRREKRVLITGGGDGHVAREVLRFPSVTSVTICDIDPLVSEVTQKYMPFMWKGAVSDPRLRLLHDDAIGFLENAEPSSFDVIISDITDPTGERSASHHLYSTRYFDAIKRTLRDGGVCVVQAQELSVKDMKHHMRLRRRVEEAFPAVRSAYVYVPSFGYPEGFILAADDRRSVELEPHEVATELRRAELTDDGFFDAAVYAAMFVLPPLVRLELTRTTPR